MFLCYFGQQSSKYFIFHLFSLLCCEVGGSSAATGQKPEAGEQNQKTGPVITKKVLPQAHTFRPLFLAT